MQSKSSFFKAFRYFLILFGNRRGILYALVKDFLHFCCPSVPMLLIFKPLFRGLWDVRFQSSGFHSCQNLNEINIGGPNGIRTRVKALRGLRPRPLDDGTLWLGD